MLSFIETASDQSDAETQIRALREELKRRKIEAERLKKEQKKRHKERLRAQEASLKKQIEVDLINIIFFIRLAYFQYILGMSDCLF